MSGLQKNKAVKKINSRERNRCIFWKLCFVLMLYVLYY
jgi:hypothetical protein